VHFTNNSRVFRAWYRAPTNLLSLCRIELNIVGHWQFCFQFQLLTPISALEVYSRWCTKPRLKNLIHWKFCFSLADFDAAVSNSASVARQRNEIDTNSRQITSLESSLESLQRQVESLRVTSGKYMWHFIFYSMLSWYPNSTGIFHFGGGGGATRPLLSDEGVEELHEDPTGLDPISPSLHRLIWFI